MSGVPSHVRKPVFSGRTDLLLNREVLLRVFCHATGDRVILLLGGYDKGKDPARRRQDHEIEVARRRLAEHLRRRQGGGWDLSGLEET